MQKYISEDSIQDLSRLLQDELGLSFATFHGFLTAIAGGPATISPSEWMDEIGITQIDFPNKEVAQRFIGAAMICYGVILDQLVAQKYEVMYSADRSHKFKNHAEKESASVEWAIGYHRGINMDLNAWYTGDDDEDAVVATLLFPIMTLYATEEDLIENFNTELSGVTVSELRKPSINALSEVASNIFLYWLSLRSPHLFSDADGCGDRGHHGGHCHDHCGDDCDGDCGGEVIQLKNHSCHCKDKSKKAKPKNKNKKS